MKFGPRAALVISTETFLFKLHNNTLGYNNAVHTLCKRPPFILYVCPTKELAVAWDLREMGSALGMGVR
jgi:hypothetical protein